MNGVCLLGIDHGEFGGWLEAVEPGPPPVRRATAPGNVRAIIPVDPDGQSFVVLTGLAHLMLREGSAYRLARGPDGTWCRAQGVDFQGFPVGWRVEGPHSFALLIEVPEVPVDHPLVEGGTWYAVVRVDDEAHIVSPP